MGRRRKDVSFNEYGVTGLSRFSGQVTEEFLRELQGASGRNIFKQMSMTDPTCGALLFAIKQMIRSADWEVRPAEKDRSKIGEEAAAFVYESMHDMSVSWSSTISGVCSMFTYGWAWGEMVFKKRSGRNSTVPSKYDDGLISLRKIAFRSQTTLDHWEFDDAGGIKAMWQRDPATGRLYRIPIAKSLLFRTTEETGSPEGRSILANAYLSWYYLKNLREIEGIGIERDLSGIPVLRIPEAVFLDDDKAAQLQQAKDLVSNLRRDEQEGIVLPYNSQYPDAYKIELLGSPGSKQIDVGGVIDRYKAEIAQVVLADFILLGHQNVGSFALARSKRDAFGIAIQGWLDSIAGVFNSHMIPKIIEVNAVFDGIEQYPIIVPKIAVMPSLEEINGLIRSLAFAKFDVTSDVNLVNSILEKYGLPLLSSEQVEAASVAARNGGVRSPEDINAIANQLGGIGARDKKE